MVDPHTEPQPYDLVHLRPGNEAGADPATPLILADTIEDQPGTYVVWHLDTHPRHQDWAAAVTAADIATITRHERGSVHTWTPSP